MSSIWKAIQRLSLPKKREQLLIAASHESLAEVLIQRSHEHNIDHIWWYHYCCKVIGGYNQDIIPFFTTRTNSKWTEISAHGSPDPFRSASWFEVPPKSHWSKLSHFPSTSHLNLTSKMQKHCKSSLEYIFPKSWDIFPKSWDIFLKSWEYLPQKLGISSPKVGSTRYLETITYPTTNQPALLSRWWISFPEVGYVSSREGSGGYSSFICSTPKKISVSPTGILKRKPFCRMFLWILFGFILTHLNCKSLIFDNFTSFISIKN